MIEILCRDRAHGWDSRGEHDRAPLELNRVRDSAHGERDSGQQCALRAR